MQTDRMYGDNLKEIIAFYNNQFKNIHKAKVYIKNPYEVPQGTKLQYGERGGYYYETQEQQHFQEEVSNIETTIRTNMKFSPEMEKEANDIIVKYNQIGPAELQKVSQIVNGNTSYRIKNKWSILEKQKRKGGKLTDIHDVLGMRIEVNNKEEIFNTVKKLKNLYGNRIVEEDNKIIIPKDKVYRSFHLKVLVGENMYGEIQIRTPLMNKVSNASHILLYKNFKNIDNKAKDEIVKTLELYSNLSVGGCCTEYLQQIDPKIKQLLKEFGL